jgi:hypothetical protein
MPLGCLQGVLGLVLGGITFAVLGVNDPFGVVYFRALRPTVGAVARPGDLATALLDFDDTGMLFPACYYARAARVRLTRLLSLSAEPGRRSMLAARYRSR